MANKIGYYVNNTAQDNGDHEVHKSDCYWLSRAKDKTYLGLFDNCRDAVNKAKETYPVTANGCAVCSYECHTS